MFSYLLHNLHVYLLAACLQTLRQIFSVGFQNLVLLLSITEMLFFLGNTIKIIQEAYTYTIFFSTVFFLYSFYLTTLLLNYKDFIYLTVIILLFDSFKDSFSFFNSVICFITFQFYFQQRCIPSALCWRLFVIFPLGLCFCHKADLKILPFHFEQFVTRIDRATALTFRYSPSMFAE